MARVRKKAKIGRLELEVMEWVAIGIAFLGLVAIFCIFFIRRHVLEYHLEHTYGVSDPEFFGSALALSAPVPLAGNKVELLQNGDESFPAMLAAIRGAKRLNSRLILFIPTVRTFRDALMNAPGWGRVRVLLTASSGD
jgi:hypothetical protein